MFQRTPFSQDELLRRAFADHGERRGVCVGMCDFWLRDVVERPDEPAADRLARLGLQFERIVQHQRHYSALFRLGAGDARLQIARRLGLEYAGQTTVLARYVGLDGIRRRLASDIRRPGAAATWGLQFAGGQGHAIAGFCGLSGEAPLLRYELHVFDPNVGEYVGSLQALDDILADLFTRLPIYRTITGVERVFGGR